MAKRGTQSNGMNKAQRQGGPGINNSGSRLWERAKQIIPGGNMLLSKRPEMFAPDCWPTYFLQASGCVVWDLDKNKYIDMSRMGIGTNILGYGDPEVDAAVMRTVRAGNMSTLNCPEEVHLAERLVQLHPWADMVKFARSGGEASAISIRIARAVTGRDHVAICGYHGWHDWYLSANLNNAKNLDSHLLPDLEPAGVPSALSGLVHPFEYNNFEQLSEIVRSAEIGVIKMEVERNIPPKEDFLKKVQNLANRKGIVLIFDECSSGFRETFGGLHKKYGLSPDIATFGKALGNGYAITAVLGKREVMEAAQRSFISSTFWTERIGPTAALQTLEVMERIRSWETITNTGKRIKDGLQRLATEHKLSIDVRGLAAMPNFNFVSERNLEYKTLISQEMLKCGFLAGNSVYASVAHTPEVIERYFEALNRSFSLISRCEDGEDVRSFLEGSVCHNGLTKFK